jgi:hypothetical protein
MSDHDAECDLTLYGSTPGVTGVLCTCDAGDGGDADDAALPPRPPAKRKKQQGVDVAMPDSITLTGARAQALQDLCDAERALRAAIARRDAAVTALTSAMVSIA